MLDCSCRGSRSSIGIHDLHRLRLAEGPPALAKINHVIGSYGSATYTGGGTNSPIRTVGGAYYIVYVDPDSDLVYTKSTNGTTWGVPILLYTGTVTSIATWYDRWSDISAGLIHIAWSESGTDDTHYRTIDTANSDALSNDVVIFAGSSTLSGGALSITRSRGGNVYCKTMIDAGSEGTFKKLANADVPNGAWSAALTEPEAIATTDQWILVPGFAADNNDIICIFWDASADEISRYVYDDSGNSWAETSIATTMVDVAASTSYTHFAAAVDLTNSQILVVAWNGVDTANQDLLGWTVTESAITAFATTPVLNATDDCGFAGIGIDTDTQDWYVFYGGSSDGSQTYNSAISFNYKKSTDDGATWGGQTDAAISGIQAAGDLVPGSITMMLTCPRFATKQIFVWGTTSFMYATVDEPAGGAASGGAHVVGGTVVR